MTYQIASTAQLALPATATANLREPFGCDPDQTINIDLV
jgi:hypothetical protein